MLDATLHDLGKLRPLLIALRDALNPLIGELSPPASVAPPPAMPANDDQAEPLLTQGSVSAFARELLSGELLGVKPSPMLSTDCYRLYEWRCRRHGRKPTSIQLLGPALERLGATVRKTRWIDDTGQQSRTPHAVVLWPGQHPPDSSKAEWFGRHIMNSRRRIMAKAQTGEVLSSD